MTLPFGRPRKLVIDVGGRKERERKRERSRGRQRELAKGRRERERERDPWRTPWFVEW